MQQQVAYQQPPHSEYYDNPHQPQQQDQIYQEHPYPPSGYPEGQQPQFMSHRNFGQQPTGLENSPDFYNQMQQHHPLSERPLFPHSQQSLQPQQTFDPIQQRKALIMAKMAEERAMRQQLISEGRINDFKLSELPYAQQRTHQTAMAVDGQETASHGVAGPPSMDAMTMMQQPAIGAIYQPTQSSNYSPEAHQQQQQNQYYNQQQRHTAPQQNYNQHHQANSNGTGVPPQNQDAAMYHHQGVSPQQFHNTNNSSLNQTQNSQVSSMDKRAMVERMLQDRRHQTTNQNSYNYSQQQQVMNSVPYQDHHSQAQDQHVDQEQPDDDGLFSDPNAIYSQQQQMPSQQTVQQPGHQEQAEYQSAIDCVRQRIRDQINHSDVQNNRDLMKELAQFDSQLIQEEGLDAQTAVDDIYSQRQGDPDPEMDEYADPSVLYAAHKQELGGGLIPDKNNREGQENLRSENNPKDRSTQRQHGRRQGPPSGAPPLPRKPPIAAVPNDAAFLKATVASDIRKTGKEPEREKSIEFMRQAKQKFSAECTFQPKINPGKEDAASIEQQIRSKEERWRRLTEPKAEAQRQRDQLKAQIEIEDIQKNCPFKPQISAKPNKRSSSAHRRRDTFNDRHGMNMTNSSSASCFSRASNARFALPIQDRLLHEADLKREKREQMKRDQEMQLMQECSFQPNLITSTQRSNSAAGMINKNKFNSTKPIHERVDLIQKEKNERLQRLRVKAEEAQIENKFHPAINTKSEKMAWIKQGQAERSTHTAGAGSNVVDRLYNDASSRIERNMKSQISIRSMQNQSVAGADPYTFHPAISDTSKVLAEQQDLYQGDYKDFQTRQTEFIERQREKRAALRNQYSEEAVFQFKPKINVMSEVICSADPTRGCETQDEAIDRLYNKERVKKQIKNEMVEQEIYKDLTFKPKINTISSRIAPDTSIIERSQNVEGIKKKEALRQEHQKREDEKCTFKPQTNLAGKKDYEQKQSEYAAHNTRQFSENLKTQLKAKQARIAQERRNREFEEEKDCTFQPKVNQKAPAIPAEDVEIKGLGRVLELRELQKKKEAEIKLRQAEVFGLNHKFAVNADQCDLRDPKPSELFPMGQVDSERPHATKPEPFNLRTEERGEHYNERFRQKVEQHKQDEETYCTFHPDVNPRRPVAQPGVYEGSDGEGKAVNLEMIDFGGSSASYAPHLQEFSNGVLMSDNHTGEAALSALESNTQRIVTTDRSPRDDLVWFKHV